MSPPPHTGKKYEILSISPPVHSRIRSEKPGKTHKIPRKCRKMQKKRRNICVYQKKAVPLHPLLRKKPCRLNKHTFNGAVVQLVRIPACHAVGREFESRPHRSQPTIKRRGSPLFLLKCCPVCLGSNRRSFETKGNGPLAQLNRVPHYGCGGCRFESCMDHIATQKSRCFSAAFFVLQINNHFF